MDVAVFSSCTPADEANGANLPSAKKSENPFYLFRLCIFILNELLLDWYGWCLPLLKF